MLASVSATQVRGLVLNSASRTPAHADPRLPLSGVHLCHAASYPISSQNKTGPKYLQEGYEAAGHPIVRRLLPYLCARSDLVSLFPSLPPFPSPLPTSFQVPHGVSVALTGPSVFSYTAPSSPDRHREILRLFGVPSSEADRLSAGDGSLGLKVKETLTAFLDGLAGFPKGLRAIGYTDNDVEALVEGVLPQVRLASLFSSGWERLRQELTAAVPGRA